MFRTRKEVVDQNFVHCPIKIADKHEGMTKRYTRSKKWDIPHATARGWQSTATTGVWRHRFDLLSHKCSLITSWCFQNFLHTLSTMRKQCFVWSVKCFKNLKFFSIHALIPHFHKMTVKSREDELTKWGKWVTECFFFVKGAPKLTPIHALISEYKGKPPEREEENLSKSKDTFLNH